MKEVFTAFLIGMALVMVVYLAVFALPDKTHVCEYEWNAQGQKIAERCWKEWGERD